MIEINGNNHEELKAAFQKAKENGKESEHKPMMILANTVKGCGISFMQNDILWHYRFPHDGWEYDCAVNELHQTKPEGVEDPYTPEGIPNPVLPTESDDINNDHTLTYTWKTTYPEKMRRVEAKSGSGEREYRV